MGNEIVGRPVKKPGAPKGNKSRMDLPTSIKTPFVSDKNRVANPPKAWPKPGAKK